MPWSSNATFLVEASADGTSHGHLQAGAGRAAAVGLPGGLYRREVAAWELSEALGWGLVPPTVIRDGPFGEGSLQLFVAADFEQHYFTLYEDEPTPRRARAICAFDLLANNTDRKSGHCLLGLDGRIWGIDNGLCFAEDQAAHGDLGVRRRARSRRVLATSPAADGVPPAVAACSTTTRSAACSGGPRRSWPRSSRSTRGRRYPWPLV